MALTVQEHEKALRNLSAGERHIYFNSEWVRWGFDPVFATAKALHDAKRVEIFQKRNSFGSVDYWARGRAR